MELIGFLIFAAIVLIGCFSGGMVILIGWILTICAEGDGR